MNVPTKLRQAGITPFVVRANQLETAKPVISYWCWYWALNQVLAKKLHTEDNECAEFCTNIFTCQADDITLLSYDVLTLG